MTDNTQPAVNQSQPDKFKEAARAAECDPDEARWDGKLRQISKQKPSPNDEKR
jgi:hypothetical protein